MPKSEPRTSGPGAADPGGAPATSEPLLDARGLTVDLRTAHGPVRVVDGVDLTIGGGEIVGLVGESGSGKSMTARTLLGLAPRGAVIDGHVDFRGRDLVPLAERDWRELRGTRIGYVAQDATVSLSPVLKVGTQLDETLRAHGVKSRAERRGRAVESLRSVGIPDAERRLGAYPHQFSGGMRQRVAIAIALSCEPELVIADEPTTALDVTVQAQIIELLVAGARSRGTSVLLISHDLRMVGAVADRVAVMYAGRIVEDGAARRITGSPAHPYAAALLRSTPRLSGERPARLQVIEGRPPDLTDPPAGCPFHPRCDRAADRCRAEDPRTEPGAACWYPLTGAGTGSGAGAGATR